MVYHTLSQYVSCIQLLKLLFGVYSFLSIIHYYASFPYLKIFLFVIIAASFL